MLWFYFLILLYILVFGFWFLDFRLWILVS